MRRTISWCRRGLRASEIDLAKPPPFLHTVRNKIIIRGIVAPEGRLAGDGGNGGHFSFDLLINALIAGLLLGGFYAAVTVGISISFGMLDIVNIAHPAFIILGSYIAYIVNTRLGLDPILVSLIMLPVFYHARRGGLSGLLRCRSKSAARRRLRGLAFFFGLLFVTEVLLILVFGVDYRYVEAAYIGPSCASASWTSRCACWCRASCRSLLFGALQIFPLAHLHRPRHHGGVAGSAGAAADGGHPIRIKRIAFGISIATAAIAGALLIIIQPVEPSVGREYIGRVFAICVLGGLGSLPGTLIAAMLLGIVESITATFYGPSWAPAVAFGFLLLTLAFRPAGLLGR